eukprot:SAG31_NODE_1312_length_8861_cov_10.803127_8_plen_132_part_00
MGARNSIAEMGWIWRTSTPTVAYHHWHRCHRRSLAPKDLAPIMGSYPMGLNLDSRFSIGMMKVSGEGGVNLRSAVSQPLRNQVHAVQLCTRPYLRVPGGHPGSHVPRRGYGRTICRTHQEHAHQLQEPSVD